MLKVDMCKAMLINSILVLYAINLSNSRLKYEKSIENRAIVNCFFNQIGITFARIF